MLGDSKLELNNTQALLTMIRQRLSELPLQSNSEFMSKNWKDCSRNLKK